MENSIKVLLVDDHEIVRGGLIMLLNSQNNIQIVADKSNVSDALDYIHSNEVDIVITDISMPGKSGFELIQELKSEKSKTKSLVLSMHLEESYIIKAIDNGASGYLLKDSDESEFVEAINEIYQGKTYFSKKVSEILAKCYINFREGIHLKGLKQITSRELDVLKCVVEGSSTKQIAGELFISQKTVDSHRHNLMKKLRAKNVADLVRISIEQKLIFF